MGMLAGRYGRYRDSERVRVLNVTQLSVRRALYQRLKRQIFLLVPKVRRCFKNIFSYGRIEIRV